MVQGSQYVFDEKVMAVDGTPPLVVIGMEGVWGTAIMPFILPIAAALPGRDLGTIENTIDSIVMVSREPDSAKAGGQLDRRRVRGVLNLCARESNARTGRFLRGKLISGHGLFSSYEDRQGTANGQDSWGFFRAAQGFGRLDAGSRADFTSSTTMDLGISISLLSV